MTRIAVIDDWQRVARKNADWSAMMKRAMNWQVSGRTWAGRRRASTLEANGILVRRNENA
jgi:hypothetical protein